MKCPRCESDNVETTTIGWLGPNDPNQATCRACGHRGNAGDWNLVAALRRDAERWRVIAPNLKVNHAIPGSIVTWISLDECVEGANLTVEQCVDRLVEEARKARKKP